MHHFCNTHSVSSYLLEEQVLAILICKVYFMNFALFLIITITTLSKILGAFNAVFSYTRISLRSLVTRVGIIHHHPEYNMREPPSTNESACMSESTICKSVGWFISGREGGLKLSATVSTCAINPYERGITVSTFVLSDLSSNQWLLWLESGFFLHCFVT